MSRGDLGEVVRSTEQVLRQIGIGKDDCVAIVHQDGAEMAALFLAIAATAAAAPLNSSYRREEFDFYLTDISAKALVIQADLDSPARDVAASRGILVIDVVAANDGVAGSFRLEPKGSGQIAKPHEATTATDVALILHTSGTTSRPKIVPLTQKNVLSSARNIADTLRLSQVDRSLVIMPLFHIHGLIGALLSSIYAGGSVFCAGSFNALKFFGFLEEAGATWYTAVPTMHQAILARADRNKDKVAAHPLRFIRSSSASMPPALLRDLEATYNCPVIESYGMTEAAHQMTSNPLPPAVRKPGSVGIAAGPEVAIMDPDGSLVQSGQEGEIVIRGDNVTLGYANNPDANAQAFTAGWFRTGDLGIIDGEGYLTISGRLKEIINRGGEKIAPREVDDVLMEHPAVALAVTFGMPHPKLGEEVAAAVVLKESMDLTEGGLREFAAQRIAAFKVPTRIVFMAEIPKGPTGKMQRIGMSKRLGLSE
jgi:acyl-CoA synthetase (AMP-forming)/AMP-acid ligase II